MDSTSLATLADDLLSRAGESRSGRAAHTVFGGTGHLLRQTGIALVGGQELSEHNSPGEATLQVLQGRVRLSSPSGSIDAGVADVVTIPPERHALTALEDAVVLLTVVVRS